MKKTFNLPEPFNFYKAVLTGDHLHFGLWPADRPELSLEDAQQFMFETILGFFPAPPVSILDVGCGLGLSAAIIAGKGYNVDAISPSGEMIDYAVDHYGKSGARFSQLDFYDEDIHILQKDRYDVILFQESSQYLGQPHNFITRARHLCKDHGVVIISDEVCYDRSIKTETAVHMASEIAATLAANGFCLIENRKVGDRVGKTFDFAIRLFKERFNDLVTGDPAKSGGLKFFFEGWKKQKEWYATGKMGYEIFVARKDNEAEIKRLHAAISDMRKDMDELQLRLDNMSGSLFWKAAEAFYRVRERFLPQHSASRGIYDRLVSVLKQRRRHGR